MIARLMLAAIRFYQRRISPANPPMLPFYAYLFPVCPDGHRALRRVEGGLAGPLAYSSLQSVLQRRL